MMVVRSRVAMAAAVWGIALLLFSLQLYLLKTSIRIADQAALPLGTILLPAIAMDHTAISIVLGARPIGPRRDQDGAIPPDMLGTSHCGPLERGSGDGRRRHGPLGGCSMGARPGHVVVVTEGRPPTVPGGLLRLERLGQRLPVQHPTAEPELRGQPGEVGVRLWLLQPGPHRVACQSEHLPPPQAGPRRPVLPPQGEHVALSVIQGLLAAPGPTEDGANHGLHGAHHPGRFEGIARGQLGGGIGPRDDADAVTILVGQDTVHGQASLMSKKTMRAFVYKDIGMLRHSISHFLAPVPPVETWRNTDSSNRKVLLCQSLWGQRPSSVRSHAPWLSIQWSRMVCSSLVTSRRRWPPGGLTFSVAS